MYIYYKNNVKFIIYEMQFVLGRFKKQFPPNTIYDPMLTDCCLTHLSRIDFPIPINWMSPFPILGLLGGIFYFYLNSKRTFCKQTVENLIKRCVLWHLNWFCTVCRCPIKRTLGLYGSILRSLVPNTKLT